MRQSASVFLALFLSLSCATPSELPDATPRESLLSMSCEPTVARMVPPQFVMDHVVGGVRPQPTVVMSREVWASDKNYLGNDLLWLDLPRDGRVRGRSVSINTYEIRPARIAVTARRSDGVPATVSVERDENPGGGPRDRAVTMVFSTPGCWEINFEQGGSDLRFVLAVVGP
jgi:hypothetical protein